VPDKRVHVHERDSQALAIRWKSPSLVNAAHPPTLTAEIVAAHVLVVVKPPEQKTTALRPPRRLRRSGSARAPPTTRPSSLMINAAARCSSRTGIGVPPPVLPVAR